jgi:hypothetical protein
MGSGHSGQRATKRAGFLSRQAGAQHSLQQLARSRKGRAESPNGARRALERLMTQGGSCHGCKLSARFCAEQAANFATAVQLPSASMPSICLARAGLARFHARTRRTMANAEYGGAIGVDRRQEPHREADSRDCRQPFAARTGIRSSAKTVTRPRQSRCVNVH